MLKEIQAEAVLEDCRALISQINAELFAEEPFVNVSRAAELQLYLEFAASALKRAASLSIIAMALAAPHYRDGADGPRLRALYRAEGISSALKEGVNVCQ